MHPILDTLRSQGLATSGTIARLKSLCKIIYHSFVFFLLNKFTYSSTVLHETGLYDCTSFVSY